MKKPNIDGIKAGVGTGVTWATKNGKPVARKAVETGQAVLKTKIGKRFATGALAGGAIAFALPLVTITTGAILGGGLMLFLKTVGDKEPPEAE